jgi:hypothetical protein
MLNEEDLPTPEDVVDNQIEVTSRKTTSIPEQQEQDEEINQSSIPQKSIGVINFEKVMK